MSDPQTTALVAPKTRGPKTPRKPRVPTLMTHEEASVAAVNAGFILVNGKRLEASAALGGYVEQLGPLKVARSWYVFAASEVQHTMSQCDGALARNPEPEVESQLLDIKKGLIGDMLLSANGMVNSCKIDITPPTPPEPPRQAGFGPGVAVQVNLNSAPPQLPPQTTLAVPAGAV